MAARNRPGVSATVLAAVAMTGGNPAASSAGKVMTAAPPTIAAMMPPAIPAATSSTPCKRSIVGDASYPGRIAIRAKRVVRCRYRSRVYRDRRSKERKPGKPALRGSLHTPSLRRSRISGASFAQVRSRCTGSGTRTLEERLDAGLGAAEDQCVNVVRALVGVDGFEI